MIRVVLASANSAITEKIRSSTESGPSRTTSSSGPSDSASVSVGTAMEATTVTTR